MGRSQAAKGMATRPTISMLKATLGGELRRPATPPVKSATPRVAAEPMAAAGDRSWLRLWIVSEAREDSWGSPARLGLYTGES